MNYATQLIIVFLLAVLVAAVLTKFAMSDDLDDWRNQSLRNQERQETYDYRLRETQRERAYEWERMERSEREPYTPRYIPNPNPPRREW